MRRGFVVCGAGAALVAAIAIACDDADHTGDVHSNRDSSTPALATKDEAMSEVRSFLIDGDRRRVAFTSAPGAFSPGAEENLAFAYALAEPPAGWVSLGASPFLERPLVVAGVPLFAPFGGTPKKGFRELFVEEPRIGRLWGRFSTDVGVALERNPKLFDALVFARRNEGYRVFIVEDGDRYAIRGMCIFQVSGETGKVVELLHDRSLEGMRAASHVLGLALRAMQKSGARVARAAALPHSGTMPMFLRHAFRRVAGPPVIVRPIDSAREDLVTYPEGWYVSALDFLGATPPA